MKKLKEIFLGQLSDVLNERAANKLLNEQRQKETIKETIIEEEILTQQLQQLKKRNKNQKVYLIGKSDNLSRISKKNNLIVGQ
ncbi:MAG: hypothetical protein WCR60_01925 [Patescibacteria group bacterium]|jgi:Ni,Fe-hydrogenase III component G